MHDFFRRLCFGMNNLIDEFHMVLGGQPTPFYFLQQNWRKAIFPCRSSAITRLCETHPIELEGNLRFNLFCALRIGYRPRWRSDIWRTDRGVAEVRSPGIRPATEDDIRHNAPGLVEETHWRRWSLGVELRRKSLNLDKPSRLRGRRTRWVLASRATACGSPFLHRKKNSPATKTNFYGGKGGKAELPCARQG